MSNQLWEHKYSPTTINDTIIEMNKKYIPYCFSKTKTFSNCIFVGSPGTGKTSIIRYCGNQIYGKEYVKENMMEILPSDPRELSEITYCLYEFCTQKVIKDKKDIPPFKIIFFDELDNISLKLQQLIISMLYDKKLINVYFAFACNDISKVCETIQSFCLIIKIPTPTCNVIVKHLKKICVAEKVNFTEEGLKTISLISNNDIRVAVNILQSVSIEGDITEKLVTKIKGIPRSKTVQKLLKLCFNKNVVDAITLVKKLLSQGINSYDIVYLALNILKTVDENKNLEESINEKNIIFLDKFGKLLNDITKGYTNNIQLFGTIAEVCNI